MLGTNLEEGLKYLKFKSIVVGIFRDSKEKLWDFWKYQKFKGLNKIWDYTRPQN